jgi:uncharacterized protein YdeI (YjbR/CyaY-like superfamily)
MIPSPRPFRSSATFGAWLDRNHDTAKELWVRLAKTSANAAGLTYKEAVDEALRIGWIDGLRKSFDAEHFMVRFTPRKPGSRWSGVNIRRARVLHEAGKMKPAGLAAFDRRRKSSYSFESREGRLDAASERALRANPSAWKFLSAQPPSYRKVTAFWVMSAKKPETRARRVEQLIASSERGEFIPPMRWSSTPPRRPR